MLPAKLTLLTLSLAGLLTALILAVATLGPAAAPAAASAAPTAARAAAPTAAGGAPCFSQLPGYAGIPPWGFHTGDPLSADAQQGWYSRAYGGIDLVTNQISGEICQAKFVAGHEGLIVMKPRSPLSFHTHVAQMWGYPGNEVVTHIEVVSSSDPSCAVHTVGTMTMYASYNNVRSDSVQYSFPAACDRQDHLYHGSQVNAQVPPL